MARTIFYHDRSLVNGGIQICQSKKRQGSIDRRKAELKLTMLSQILGRRGYHLDSDLEWSKK